MREFYRLRFKGGKMFDEQQILSKISPPLRNEILHYNSRVLYSLVPLLRNTPLGVFKAFSQQLESTIHAAADVVVGEGESAEGSGMYFILNGMAEVLTQSHGGRALLSSGRAVGSAADGAPEPAPIVTIGDGCYFGEVALVLI